MNGESVDLIYLDPPFNSNRTYEAPIGSVAAGAAFKDAWTLDDTDVAWHGEIAEQSPKLYEVVRAGRSAGGDSMMAYLVMMAVRLIHLRRVLKPTGSIYLHCDPTASHYLKLLMDVLFGRAQFRNEIVWKRSSRSDGRRFGWTHDILLAYCGSGRPKWNNVYLAHEKDYLDQFYREKDDRGRYKRADLTGPGVTEGESGKPWRDADPTSVGRCWSVPKTGAYAVWIEAEIIPGYRDISSVHGRLDALEAAELIHWPKTGKGWPMLKRYLAASPGRRPNDVFDDIRPISNLSKERVGYPTQKPLALLERIIKASSNPGDVVLDPFCGCATALVAAERLGRRWVGIDLSELAVKLVKQRLQQVMGMFYEVHHRTDIPQRTDMGKLPNYRTHKHRLYGKQEGNCYGCKAHFPYKNLTVDHVVPSSLGGSDHYDNLQLLCGWCNSKKGTKSQEEFLAEMQKVG